MDPMPAPERLRLPEHRSRRLGLLGLSAFFVAAGVNHFVNPSFYVAIMPPFVPAHLTLVYVSGAFEVLGGLSVLVPRLRSVAGWALVGLLLAVFPANIHMALNPELFPDVSPIVLYVRLPLQLLLMGWAVWATR